jgi:ABC-type lipoprotein release transport system permease subunit
LSKSDQTTLAHRFNYRGREEHRDDYSRGLLVGMSPSDPPILLAAAFGLLLVTMATRYVPARRALRIEPAQLLRHE